jgi:hypothetical protein
MQNDQPPPVAPDDTPTRLLTDREHIVELRAEVSRLREALKQWESWGIIEIAVRNQSVSDYMDHWEGRALKAEADVSRLQQENALLRRSLEMLTKQMAE